MLSGTLLIDLHADAFSFPKEKYSWIDQKKLFGDLRIHNGRLLYNANQREIIALVFFIKKLLNFSELTIYEYLGWTKHTENLLHWLGEFSSYAYQNSESNFVW